MGTGKSKDNKINFDVDYVDTSNCTVCTRFSQMRENECQDGFKFYECSILPSGKKLLFSKSLCLYHIRCIFCLKHPIDYTNCVVSYNSLQLSIYLCNDCFPHKDPIKSAICCISQHFEYKNAIFYELLVKFDLLPHDLKLILLSYCTFFPLEDYLVTQGITFRENI
jgi:hypothetical protein